MVSQITAADLQMAPYIAKRHLTVGRVVQKFATWPNNPKRTKYRSQNTRRSNRACGIIMQPIIYQMTRTRQNSLGAPATQAPDLP